MTTLHVVSHTHWDREWYLPFQEFRFRLVHLIDHLLDLLDSDSEYRSFLLDGQTIVLDDYLEIRPEHEQRVRQLVREGRLLVGPWYVLPDEFLEGPEALIRNALFGRRGCRRFTPHPQPMERIGYLPDPFGQISQLPQIASLLDMEALCFWRGVGDAPTEFRWAAPDGTECLVLHLRTAYGNAARLAADDAGFIRDLASARDVLSPHATTSHLLLMHGTDHMAPREDLTGRLESARKALKEQIVHSTLPAYLDAVRSELGGQGMAALPRLQGELRSPQMAHLLPAVLSSRIWIKQCNHRCETLLTRWAEPFSALAEHIAGSPDLQPFVLQAWDWLLQNHAHDSICGCSVDQVHREMQTRFSWSEQIAEQVTQTSLDTLARNLCSASPTSSNADTSRDRLADAPGPWQAGSILVFNPLSAPASGRVSVHVPSMPESGWRIVGANGVPVPARLLERVTREHFSEFMDRDQLMAWLSHIAAGAGPSPGELAFHHLETTVDAGVAQLDLILVAGLPSGDQLDAMHDGMLRVQALLADETIRCFRVRALEDVGARLELLALEVPPVGYAPYALEACSEAPSGPRQTKHNTLQGTRIENEFFVVEPNATDGTVTIIDKATGMVVPAANRFVDGGDRGDEYTHTPPEHDHLIELPVRPPTISIEDDGIGRTIRIDLLYRIPRSLADQDRSRRSTELTDLPITTRITLIAGIRRVEFETAVRNQARDHRLRVHFQTSLVTGHSCAEGHFDVVKRPVELPPDTTGWAEQPSGTHPQLTFVDLSDGQQGLMVANRGLPEFEALPGTGDSPGVTLALTMLRCVGWLSRGDLHNRTGHAGPLVSTPEAQCPGEFTFHYALIPHTGNYMNALHEAHAFSAGLRAVCQAVATRRQPVASSFLEITPAAAVLSTLKLPDHDDGLLVRIFNSASVPIQARIRLWRPFAHASLVPLHEQGPGQTLASDAGSVEVPLRAWEIATVRFSD